MAKTLEERFWGMVTPTGFCWEWRGSLRDGYGKINVAGSRGGRIATAHRVAYEMLIGPIPEGMQIDHLCRNRACVNPDHLEPVSAQENMARGAWARRNKCRKGHLLTGDNVRIRPDGARACRACDRISQARYRARKARDEVFA